MVACIKFHGPARESHALPLAVHRRPRSCRVHGAASTGRNHVRRWRGLIRAAHPGAAAYATTRGCLNRLGSQPGRVSNRLSGERKFRIFEELVEKDDEFAHDGGQRDLLGFTGRDKALAKHPEDGIKTSGDRGGHGARGGPSHGRPGSFVGHDMGQAREGQALPLAIRPPEPGGKASAGAQP
jgi:hypothetical protein